MPTGKYYIWHYKKNIDDRSQNNMRSDSNISKLNKNIKKYFLMKIFLNFYQKEIYPISHILKNKILLFSWNLNVLFYQIRLTRLEPIAETMNRNRWLFFYIPVHFEYGVQSRQLLNVPDSRCVNLTLYTFLLI